MAVPAKKIDSRAERPTDRNFPSSNTPEGTRARATTQPSHRKSLRRRAEAAQRNETIACLPGRMEALETSRVQHLPVRPGLQHSLRQQEKRRIWNSWSRTCTNGTTPGKRSGPPTSWAPIWISCSPMSRWSSARPPIRATIPTRRSIKTGPCVCDVQVTEHYRDRRANRRLCRGLGAHHGQAGSGSARNRS